MEYQFRRVFACMECQGCGLTTETIWGYEKVSTDSTPPKEVFLPAIIPFSRCKWCEGTSLKVKEAYLIQDLPKKKNRN